MEDILILVAAAVAVLVIVVTLRTRRVSRRDRPVARKVGSAPPRPGWGQPGADSRTRAAGTDRAEVFDPKTAVPVAAGAQVLEGRAYVIDGDSLSIRKKQLRLFGVDAPELNHPYGKKAKSALINLCKGQDIRAEVTAVDDHGRHVARCTLPDGRDLSAEMVKLGLAIDWAKFSGGVYRALEVPDARKKMWLADARQKGRMHVWRAYEARQAK